MSIDVFNAVMACLCIIGFGALTIGFLKIIFGDKR